MPTHVRRLSHALKLPLGSVDAEVTGATTELRLGFAERADLKFSDLVLAGAIGEVPTGASAPSPRNDQAPSVPVAGQLVPGACEVDWRARRRRPQGDRQS